MLSVPLVLATLASAGSASAQCTNCVAAVNLPTALINYTGSENFPKTQTALGGPGFFAVTLNGVPGDQTYSVNNTTVYNAWCADYFSTPFYNDSSNAVNGFKLLSTYPPSSGSIPAANVPLNGNFNEVNYILNHKTGNLEDVQDAIWAIMIGTGSGQIPAADLPLSANAASMVAAALLNPNYVPGMGGVMALLVPLNPIASGPAYAQDLILEIPVPTLGSIGDFVWSDTNHNGIQDAGELGINGVTVKLLDSTGANVLANTTTATFMGNAGYYQFSGLLAGTYQVQVDTTSPALTGLTASPVAQGGNPALDSNANPSVVTLATNSSSDETIDFGFYTSCTGSIGSIVFSDTNANGIQDAGELGIGGVTLTLNGPGGLTATTTTNGTGVYSFTGLCGGTYTVTAGTGLPAGSIESPVVTPGALPTNVGTNNAASVTLPANNSGNPTVDFGYHAPCTGAIGNTVFNDLNGNGVQDAGEPGINGVTLTLLNMATNLSTTTTTMQIAGVNGSYQFAGLCPAQYTVTVGTGVPAGLTPSPVVVNTNTNVNANAGSPDTVTLGAGMTNPNVDFGFTPPCTAQIGDLVWNDANGNGIQDAGELGIAGVTVNLRNATTNSILQTTTTIAGGMANTAGNYIFKGLCAGSYKVEVIPPASYTATPANASGSTTANDSNPNPFSPITIAEVVTGGTPTGVLNNDLTIDFGFYQLSAISGTVYTDVNTDKVFDNGDSTLGGVTVTLTGKDVTGKTISLSTTTAPNGTYSFPNLFAGSYTVSSPATVGTETLETTGSLSVALAANVPSTGNNFGYVLPKVTPLVVTCATSTAQVGSAYNSAVAVTGGVSPYTFSISAGALPNGLSLNPSTGAITGTPTAAGTSGYTVKVVDHAGSVAYSACTGSCAGGTPSSWNIVASLGNLGNSFSWTSNGVALTAYGFTNGGTATAMYSKNQGSTELGIGIASDSDHEINTSTFIQLDVSALKAAGVTNAQILFSSVQSGETWDVYGSNTLGTLGTLVAGPSATANTLIAMPGYGTYKYIGVRAGAANILIGGVAGTFPTTCSITVAAAPAPKLVMTKTASATKVNPFQPVTYTYKVTNAGTTTVTNILVTDDNATPGYTADDVTVGTIGSLAPGASATLTATLIPPVTEGGNQVWGGGWNQNFDYNNATPAGTLICKQLSNGHVQMTWRQDPSMNDNTYGSNSSSDWGQNGHNFSDMIGNNSAEFQFLDKNGNVKLDMQTDYVSQSRNYPSGYGTAGVNGNNCGVYSGDSRKIVNVDTTLSHCLNQSPSFYQCTKNSPSSGTPGWDTVVGYTVEVDGSIFGSSGFGGVAIPQCQSAPSKGNNGGDGGWGGWGGWGGGNNTWAKPISSSATNTATATGSSNGLTISTKATATVQIDASQQGWGQCNNY